MPWLVLIAQNSNIHKFYLKIYIASEHDLGEERLAGWMALCPWGAWRFLNKLSRRRGLVCWLERALVWGLYVFCSKTSYPWVVIIIKKLLPIGPGAFFLIQWMQSHLFDLGCSPSNYKYKLSRLKHRRFFFLSYMK